MHNEKNNRASKVEKLGMAGESIIIIVIEGLQQPEEMHAHGANHEEMPDRMRLPPDIKPAGVVTFGESALMSMLAVSEPTKKKDK